MRLSFTTIVKPSVLRRVLGHELAKLNRRCPSQAAVEQFAKDRNLRQLLASVAEFERIGATVPRRGAELLNAAFMCRERRIEVANHAAELLKGNPESVLLLYFRVIGLVKQARHEEAYRVIDAALSRAHRDHASPASSKRKRAHRIAQLTGIWHAVDKAMRNDAGNPIVLDVGPDLPEVADREVAAGQASLKATTRLLETPEGVDQYLSQCQSQYEAATTLLEKLKTVNSMLKTSRRTQSNAAAQLLAQTRYDQCRPLWRKDNAREDLVKNVPALALLLEISRKLNLSDDELWLLETISHHIDQVGARLNHWTVAEVVSKKLTPQSRELAKYLLCCRDDKPARTNDVKSYFAAARALDLSSQADALFASLSEEMKRSPAVLPYADTLERAGNFSAALGIVSDVATTLLESPKDFNVNLHWKLCEFESGRIEFLRDTSYWYQQVPQPRDPIGILFLTSYKWWELRGVPIVSTNGT